jgi:hypothetical protein
MSQGGSGDQGASSSRWVPEKCRGTASKEHSVEGASADAGPSHAFVVGFGHASDGAVDSELPPEAQRGLALEPDAPPSPEGVRIGVLPGQPGCEGPELAMAAAEVDVSHVADGNSGTPAASRDENLQVWLNDTQERRRVARCDGASDA